MRIVTLTSGGQVSIPADIRRKWPSRRAIVEERPDGSVLVRPLPADVVRSIMGSFARPGVSVETILDDERAAEAESDEDEWGWLDRP